MLRNSHFKKNSHLRLLKEALMEGGLDTRLTRVRNQQAITMVCTARTDFLLKTFSRRVVWTMTHVKPIFPNNHLLICYTTELTKTQHETILEIKINLASININSSFRKSTIDSILFTKLHSRFLNLQA